MKGGVSLGGAHQAEVTLRKMGATPLLWTRIAESAGLARKVVALVFNHSEDYIVRVDCTKTLAEMVAAGNYDSVAPNIRVDNFPVKGTGVTDVCIVLFCFGKEVTTKWVEGEMRSLGYRQARIEELLTLGAAKPLLQMKSPIIALGSRSPKLLSAECNGDFDTYVPVLGSLKDKRRVSIQPYNMVWDENCSFAAVRMQKLI